VSKGRGARSTQVFQRNRGEAIDGAWAAGEKTVGQKRIVGDGINGQQRTTREFESRKKKEKC